MSCRLQLSRQAKTTQAMTNNNKKDWRKSQLRQQRKAYLIKSDQNSHGRVQGQWQKQNDYCRQEDTAQYLQALEGLAGIYTDHIAAVKEGLIKSSGAYIRLRLVVVLAY